MKLANAIVEHAVSLAFVASVTRFWEQPFPKREN